MQYNLLTCCYNCLFEVRGTWILRLYFLT